MKRENETARILAVEDLPDIRVLLRYLLNGSFELVVAASYEEALRRATCESFDLFLLDVNLGEQRTGLDLLHALRRLPGYAATPAVACTAYAMRGDSERFLAAGFDAHVGKPFTREQLLKAVRTTLARARDARALLLQSALAQTRAAA